MYLNLQLHVFSENTYFFYMKQEKQINIGVKFDWEFYAFRKRRF